MSELVTYQIFEVDIHLYQNTVQIYGNSFTEYIVNETESCAVYKCNVEHRSPL